MSWKGFQKAIARLPQIVKQKTGLASGTVDEEFKELNSTYLRICQDTKKFLDEAISYKAAMLSLMTFQVSLVEEHQWHLQELTKGQDLGQAIADLQQLRAELSGELEAKVDKLLIKPLTEYQMLLNKVEALIKKRNNKLLDYDRHRENYNKITGKGQTSSNLNEEKKILKQEQQLNQSTMEYEHYSNLLKMELPRLLELRSELMKPGVEAILSFQQEFYAKSSRIFSSSTLGSLASRTKVADPQAKYDQSIDPIMREIRNLGMFHGTSFAGTGLSPSLSAATIRSSSSQPEIPPPAYTPSTTKQSLLDSDSKKKAPHLVKALYDFSSEDADDLKFTVGEVIEVVESSDQYGWWSGRVKGTQKVGNFPSNYVQKL